MSFIRVTCSARVLLHNIISVKFSLPLTNTAIDQGYSLVNFWGGVMLEDLKEEVYYAYCSAVLYNTGDNAHSMVMISKIIRRDVMQTLVYKERNDV